MDQIISFLKKVRGSLRHLLVGNLSYEHNDIQQSLERIQLAIGRSEARVSRSSKLTHIQDAEFRVFSQFGEDGIIQYLISQTRIKEPVFVELGVGSYEESNTRFLLMNNNWVGRIVDSGNEHQEYLRGKGKHLYLHHDIEAVSAFITRENVTTILKNLQLPRDIGLLSIDLDGMDYWIWDAISSVDPRIVIIEYNSLFGPDRSVTVPYTPRFDRTSAHYSNLYFGASLQAMVDLGKRKGYRFVGSSSAGLNAFFVRRDLARGVPTLSAKKGFVKNRFRESKDRNGNLTYINTHEDRLKLIGHKKLLDLSKNRLVEINKLFPATDSRRKTRAR